ncbi:MAG: hypothetical protein OJF59_002886 [Cytophagales bacterium]|jgi:putative SOS response-associated peptidase YedK|nr:MAG: hypothetical protein OJF59_002886 [Cytophagales bacterium]
MIERFSIAAPAAQLASRFEVEEPQSFHARYNAAPSQLLPVITSSGSGGFSFFYWGQPPGLSKNKTLAEKIINVRAELIAEKPVLLRNLKLNRCLVPSDGFYSWKKVGKKTLIPWRFSLESNEIFSMPAFWEEYEDTDGNTIHTFAILTTIATQPVAAVTDRMPVIFERKEEKIWLSQNSTEDELKSLLQISRSVTLNGYPVSPQLNNLAIDRPSLILPTPAADQFGNLTLFE